MGNKLLVICGPTATGKTALALHLAEVFSGELISADSRQVYKYMDIGTGKDKPEGRNIYGYDLVNPDEEFSVSQYIDFAKECIRSIHETNKLPILVGGTGFYIKGAVDGIDTFNIPRNENLRKELASSSVSELQEKLKNVSLFKFTAMNDSDVKNPRRLVRAIEVASSTMHSDKLSNDYDVLFIGLKLSKEELHKRIEKRVDERVKLGFEKELNFLKSKGYFAAISKTIGYKDWPDVEKWKREEIKYAKRQMTWFARNQHINWFDVSEDAYIEKIEKLVKKWYATN